MNILFIAPVPPPVTGHSLAAKIFHDELKKSNKILLVNFNKSDFRNGLNSFVRIIEILGILKSIYIKRRNADVIYFTISQSMAGNIKDLFIYLICFKKLNKMYIHLHGGSLKKALFDKYKFLYKLNKYFISRVGGVIVLSESHVTVFDGILDRNRIHIVPNFAQDYLFLNNAEIVKKFSKTNPLKVLFLSNMIYGKGFEYLLKAYISLKEEIRKLIIVDFAGSFESEDSKAEFINAIKDFEQIKYHGIADGEAKKRLLANAHVFCLPTFLLEGQPISILEAYASGCVVITTGVGGILDIFTDKVNGFQIEQKSANSIASVFEQIIYNTGCLLPMALNNNRVANSKYRTSKYNLSLLEVIRE
jgi:glycosyltransferase involved in cell wall biosynthesis